MKTRMLSIIALFVMSSIMNLVDAQSINVIGTGECGFAGDGGPATQARLNHPAGLAFDAAGNLYIADLSNHVVRRVSTTGIMSTIAGVGLPGYNGDNQPATSAMLNAPVDVAVDNILQMLYIADNANHRIRAISLLTKTIRTVAGTGQQGFNGNGKQASESLLNHPSGVAVDLFGNLYIADTMNHRVRRVDRLGVIATIGTFDQPVAVATDVRGSIYVADRTAHKVFVIDAEFDTSDFAGNGTYAFPTDGANATASAMKFPHALATSPDGSVYIADYASNSVVQIMPDRILRVRLNLGPTGFPAGLAMDNTGSLYASDNLNCRIIRID